MIALTDEAIASLIMARTGKDRRAGRVDTEKTNTYSEVPSVYREMLADTLSSPTQVSEEGKTVKRRRVAGRMVTQGNEKAMRDQFNHESGAADDDTDTEKYLLKRNAPREQTVYDESEDSVDSDVDWEEVDLTHDFKGEDPSEQDNVDNMELNIVLGNDADRVHKQEAPKRRPVTAAERQLRLEIHKMHLLSLLVHVHIRNHWCNDTKVHVCLIHGLCVTTWLKCLRQR